MFAGILGVIFIVGFIKVIVKIEKIWRKNDKILYDYWKKEEK